MESVPQGDPVLTKDNSFIVSMAHLPSYQGHQTSVPGNPIPGTSLGRICAL